MYNKFMKKELLVIFLLLLFTLPASKSLFISGGFTSHDLTHHVVRQIDMDRFLKEGQFPPRWSGQLANGFGYPLFMFNYPLPPLIGQIFHIVGFNFLDSVKAVFFLSFVFSTLGMYLFLKSFFKSYMGAFLGAIFYLYAPIHLITVYVSGSPGAAMGLVFPPFIFWAITKLSQSKNTKFVLVGSLSFAGMILSHNISAFIFIPLILGFIAVLKFSGIKREDRGFFKDLGFIFLIGLGLSAFFWLPALVEKQYIRYDQLMQRIYVDQFPTLKQIIYSPWGYGLSHPKQPEGGMSYQIGLVHIFVLLLLLTQIYKFRKDKTFLSVAIFLILASLVSVFFMLEISLPFWDKIPFLSYIQFPVRLLIVPVFCASIASALLIKYMKRRLVWFIVLLFLVLYANRNHLGINQKYNPGEKYYESLQTSATSFDEDLPKWVLKIQSKPSEGKFLFLKGNGNINILEDKSNKVIASIESTASASLRFNQYYFPEWSLKVDGKVVDFNYSKDLENSGLPVFNLEKGKHLVTAEFKNTTLRNIADFLSLISVIIWFSLVCKLLVHKQFQKKK